MRLYVLSASAFPDVEYIVGVYSTQARAKVVAKKFKQGPNDWHMTITIRVLDETRDM